MNCLMKHAHDSQHSGTGCCCGGQNSPLNNAMWSSKKKVRYLENRLKELNEQKSDIQELIEEIKGK